MNQKWTIVALVLLAGCLRYHPQPLLPTETAAKLEARTLDDPALREFLEKQRQRRFEIWPPKSWDFELLNLAAFYYHPSLDVARAQWEVAEGGEKTAAARPNPILTVVPGYDISATRPVSPWFPSVTLEVPLETAGKRGHRRSQARHLSESARLSIFVTAWQVRSNLRSSLIDLIAARQREGLLQTQKSIQDKILRALDQQLQAGAISSSEVTLVRISRDKIRLDLSEAQQQSAEALVRVASAIGVSVKALDGVDLAYDLSAQPPVGSEFVSGEVRRRALQSRADILVALAEYAASQSALQLEIAKQYPDVHLGPGYQYDQGDHKFSLALTAELPLLNQNQGPISQAEARRTEAAARFNALQAKVITEIDRAVAMHRVAQENLSTLDSLAKSQKERTEAMEAQVKAGAADQFDLLNSQIELSANELLQLNARVKLQQSFGALEEAVQRPIDSLQPALIEQGQRP